MLLGRCSPLEPPASCVAWSSAGVDELSSTPSLAAASRSRPPRRWSRNRICSASRSMSGSRPSSTGAKLDPNRLRVRRTGTPYQAVRSVQRTRTDVGAFSRLAGPPTSTASWSSARRAGIGRPADMLSSSTISYRRTPSGGVAPSAVKIAWPEVNGFSRLDPNQLQRTVDRVEGAVGSTACGRVAALATRLLADWLGLVSHRADESLLARRSSPRALVFAAFVLLRRGCRVPPRAKAPPLSRLERALVRSSGRGRSRPSAEGARAAGGGARSSGRGSLAGTRRSWRGRARAEARPHSALNRPGPP